MDYPITWLHASLVLNSGMEPGSANPIPLAGSGDDGPVGAAFPWNIEDVDLLVAFAEGTGYRVVMFEAKGYTGWNHAQLVSKVTRLGSLFGDEGHRFPGVEPHLVFVSPGHPPVENIPWATWMLSPKDGHPYHLPLPQPVEQKLEVTRGSATSHHWWVRPSVWPRPQGAVNPRLPE